MDDTVATPNQRRITQGVQGLSPYGPTNWKRPLGLFQAGKALHKIATMPTGEEYLRYWEAEDSVMAEYKAALKYAPMNSAHEGFSVLKEEVDELWDHVKVKQGARDVAKMRAEAVQVAAMAIRFIVDVCDSEQAGQK